MSRVILVLSAATLLMTAASCTQISTGPQSPRAPELLRVTDPFTAPLGQQDPKPAKVDATVQASARLIAADGGTITAGRHTITIFAPALEADALVTVQVMEKDGKVGCVLLPHGITFSTPVPPAMDRIDVATFQRTTLQSTSPSRGLVAQVG